jgi:ferritin-like metal-binding protein YciE
MATSKGRGGTVSKSASKKSARSAAGSKRRSVPSKAAASRGGKAAAARKGTATKASAVKKAAKKKSAPASAAGRRAAAVSPRSTLLKASAVSRNASPRNDLEKILLDLMKDIYYAEKKLVKALGKMAKKTTNNRLRDAFMMHQSQTEDQVQKLERTFDMIGQKPRAKKCPAMDGLIEEAEEHMQEYGRGAGLDAALIVGAQKAEHYEIAAYGSMRSIAATLGYTDAARIFDAILTQESDTDELLSRIAENVVNLRAEEEKGGSGNDGRPGHTSSFGMGSEDSEAGEDSSSAYSGSMSNDDNDDDYVLENDGAGRGISALTDGNDRGELSETGPAMGY